MNKDIFHSLKGNNIYFKKISKDDVKSIHDYASDKEVSRFIGWELTDNLHETDLLVDKFIKNELEETHLYASVVLEKTNLVIGTIIIFNFNEQSNQAEIGYVFNKKYWGKGYGSESLRMATDFAFKFLKLHKLHAIVTEDNIGSSRILEKNGYQQEGKLKDHFFIEDKYYDALIFGKIN